jgi:ornithine cyclodeaminase/alanine dehydrogenase-like protein (mu-crystallin family)
MTLRILSNANVSQLLHTLNADDIATLLNTLGDALASYSVGHEHLFQCHRQAVDRGHGPTMLFMPATLPGCSSVKVVGVPAPIPPQALTPSSSAVPPKPISGAIMVCDADGRASGLVNAAEITAFRTSLGSILAYQHRRRTANLVVFGAGKQALWHLRLALMLRGADIRSVVIVSRSEGRARGLLAHLKEMDRVGVSSSSQHVHFSIVAADSSPEQGDRLESLVRNADVIFCTTPSRVPLFPGEWLLSKSRSSAGPFISAIGSYKLDMQEIDPELLKAVVLDGKGPLASNTHTGGNGQRGEGVILVDSREACAQEAGEIVLAGLPAESQLEIGFIHDRLKTSDAESRERLVSWLGEGFVVYKSVGLGIMDLAVSNALLDLAVSKEVGTCLDAF